MDIMNSEKRCHKLDRVIDIPHQRYSMHPPRPLIIIFATAFILAIILCPTAAADNKTVMEYFREGCDYYESKQYTDAIASFDSAIKLEPGFSPSWYNRGVAYLEQRKYRNALESFDRAIEIDPYYTSALINRGIILRNLGEHDAALDSYRRALEISPHSAEIWNNMGVVYSDLGRVDDEFFAYEKALSIDPMYAAAWDNKGMALASQGRYDEALEAFKKALAIDPDDEVVRYRRDALKQRQDVLAMVFRLGVIGSVVVVGYVGYRVWKRRYA
jgi:tetratricopeptide (TPR) repeat protein